ncbi:uncharacterized protein [Blastocystis hominis]|uniref:G-patch domain-containing protein n=1 Tax=Blastocystis hominis TaxID=12968 RepID=D8MAK2_BLAHO|nr:uncharacterized protein [Blastocystis hominis]CBK25091.2 unnamed protein product [Blastocystis hominis]|eukprot:XP_012899139.1 uncharacterized protein [Blastocystis hominis]
MASGADIQRLGRKHMEMLSSMQNISASSGTSVYGKKILKMMGWADGEGLGKEGTGIKESIIVKKKDDEEGVGYKEEQSNKWGECWWFNAYDSAVKKIGSSSTDTDSESDSSVSVSTPKVYSDAELFAACKGRRLGMRARRSQAKD